MFGGNMGKIELALDTWKEFGGLTQSLSKVSILAIFTGGITLMAQEPLAPDAAPDETKAVPIDTGGEVQAAAASGSGDSSGTPGVPGGNSSVPGANDLLNFQTDLFTGRFSYSVPIIAAPGRQGSEPKLALVYNSAAGNGWCGVGWSLEIGYIERDTKKAIPVKWGTRDPLKEYDDSAGFVFHVAGANGTLINIGGNDYRNEIDRNFLKFKYYENYWEVTDRNGMKLYFGESSGSRMYHPDTGWTANASKSTFRWALNRVVDPNGNQTTFTYSLFDNYLYLSQISYNANINGGVSGTHAIDFTLQ